MVTGLKTPELKDQAMQPVVHTVHILAIILIYGLLFRPNKRHYQLVNGEPNQQLLS